MAVACPKLGSDLNQVIAISTTTPDSLEEYNVLVPKAAALNGLGVPDTTVTIRWASLDSVLTVDTATGRTVANRLGLSGRLQAHVGNFFSNPIAIRTLVAADTLFATGVTTITVTLSSSTPPDSLSPALRVTLADTVTTPLATIPLAGRPVVFAIIKPATAGPVTLVTSDTTGHALVAAATMTTDALGVAFVRVRLLADALPDSIAVTASARRAASPPKDTVRGSPVTFTVRFQ